MMASSSQKAIPPQTKSQFKSGQIISTTEHHQNHIEKGKEDNLIYKRQKFVVARLFLNHCILLPILNTEMQGLRSRCNMDEFISIRDRTDRDPAAAETIHGTLFCTTSAKYLNHPDPNFGFSDKATVPFTASETFSYGLRCFHIGDLEPDSKHRLIGLWLCYLTARMTHEFPIQPNQEDMKRIRDDERQKVKAAGRIQAYTQKVREFEKAKERQRRRDVELAIEAQQTKVSPLSGPRFGNEHRSVFSSMAEKVKQLSRSSSLNTKRNGNKTSTELSPREQRPAGRQERSHSVGRSNELEHKGRAVENFQNNQSSTNARPPQGLEQTVGSSGRQNMFAQVDFGSADANTNTNRNKPLPARPQAGVPLTPWPSSISRPSSSRRPSLSSRVPRGEGRGQASDGSYFF